MATTTKKRPSPRAVLLKCLEYMANGEYDDDLDIFFNNIRQRQGFLREQRAAHAMLTLRKAGTRVRLVNLSPKYLCGLTGEVVPQPKYFRSTKPNMLHIKLDAGAVGRGRRRFGPVVGVPASCVEAE